MVLYASRTARDGGVLRGEGRGEREEVGPTRLAVWALDIRQTALKPFHPTTGFNEKVVAQHGLFVPVMPRYARDRDYAPSALEDEVNDRDGGR